MPERDYAWEFASSRERQSSVLLLREGGNFFIGFNVPSPDSPVFERSMLSPYAMPPNKKFGAPFVMELLRERKSNET